MSGHVDLDLDLDFVPPSVPMFSDVIASIGRRESLSATRRRDLISGLRRVARALGRDPQEVPCYPPWLQPRLAKLSPAALGLKPKAWQNALSDARAAMVQAGIVPRRQHSILDLSDDWRNLWHSVLESDDPTVKPALGRFVYFLNRRGVAPDRVTSADALAYRDALQHNEISKSPEVAYRAAVNGWNLAVKRIAGWPRITLPLPSRVIRKCLPDDAFPQRFQDEITALMQRLARPDPLADQGRLRALRPATLKVYRSRILRFASELVGSGIEAAEINSIAMLLAPEMAERGLRQMLHDSNGQITPIISETASLLRNLGRTTQQPKPAQDRLAELARKLALPPRRGMTGKNRDRLRVLQDQGTLQRLLWLPERLFAKPSSSKTSRFTAALAREGAVAIAILLYCPIRAKNLAQINIEQHLQRPGDGRVYLVINERDTKNARPLEFELPATVVRMIDRHLASRCPELCPRGTPWLFPRRDGAGPVLSSQLAGRISKRIRKETGIEMHTHLFRHLAVMNWLDANPGSYETARRLLGHSELSHTINLYSGLEVTTATRAFADLVTARMEGRP